MILNPNVRRLFGESESETRARTCVEIARACGRFWLEPMLDDAIQGLATSAVEALVRGQVPPVAESGRERAVAALATEVTQTPPRVSEDTRAALQEHFTPEETEELAAHIAAVNRDARTNAVLRGRVDV